MAIADSSFKMCVNSDLTGDYAGLKSLTHNTDLTGEPREFDIYLGSTNTARRMRVDSAYGTPGTDDLTLTPTDILPSWVTATAYTFAGINKIEPSTPNGYRYELVTEGTSGGSEPTWPTSGVGSTVADGTCVWRFVGAKHATTEVTLALSSGDLDTNTPGAALVLGPEILGGTAEALRIYVRVENAVTVVNSGRDIGLFINEFQEESI